MTHIEVSVSGYICGNIWMPDAKCGMPINASITDQRDRFSEPGATLRDCLDSILMKNGGDFQCTMFTADTVIIVKSESATKTSRSVRTRYWDITSFPSVADLVDMESYGSDFCGDDFGSDE